MHEHNSSIPSHARPQWTEDRVERLLLALFAEEPVISAVSAPTARGNRARNGLMVAVAAVCLAMIVPAMSARVTETTGEQTPLARWVGPIPASSAMEMNIASADDSESMSSHSNESDGESDETAEAPTPADTEESAST